MKPLEDADEEHLVRRTAKGDRAAFEELYRRTSPWLAVRLRRRCADEQVVAEVMQETYLAVWRAAGSFAGSAAAWAPRSAGCGSSPPGDWSTRSAAWAHHAQPPPVMALDVAPVPGAEEEALAAAVGDEVGDALRDLAPELRAVLQAMVLDGLTVRETAVLLGLPEGTVKTRARRARIAMREALS